MLLHTNALHTNTFIHRSFADTDAFTHKGFDIQRLDTQTRLTQRITKMLLHTEGCAGQLKIAILTQFLTIEPHFVGKGSAGSLKIEILPQFLAIEPHFV